MNPSVPLWQIRVMSKEPTLIQDKELISARTLREVMERARVTVTRTSYMVNGPNREVKWSVDRWNYKKQEWQSIIQGTSRLTEGRKPHE